MLAVPSIKGGDSMKSTFIRHWRTYSELRSGPYLHAHKCVHKDRQILEVL